MIEMQPIDPSITTESLTTAKVDGNGTFDTLMRAFKVHLDEEFSKGRITGAEYSKVYLGGLQQVMQTALSFTLAQRATTLDNQLKEEQIELVQIQQRQAEEQILQTIAQTDLIKQQKVNLQDELLTSAKQREKMDAEIENLKLQKEILAAQIIEMQQRGEMIKQQILNLKDELLTSIEQRNKIKQEVLNLQAQLPLIVAQVAEMQKRGELVTQQIVNLKDELLTQQTTRSRVDAERSLIIQKTNTERAQTDDNIVGSNSVLGTQIAVQRGQANGFLRDAEQKAAQILAQTWMTRRTTDEGVQANGDNRLDDGSIGIVISKLINGLG
jgi:chromosome segregation ATPase